MSLPGTNLVHVARGSDNRVTLDSFDSVLKHLSTVHPSRYVTLVEGLDAIGMTGYWWTSTPDSTIFAYCRELNYIDSDVLQTMQVRGNGFSVRCVRD